MNADNFDWAALAQQWIQNNSSLPSSSITDYNTPAISDNIPEAPPPPIISSNVSDELTFNKTYEEQGEADMEVVKDDDENVHNYNIHQPQQNFVQQINENVIHQQFTTHTSNMPPQVWFGQPSTQPIPYCNPWNQWQTPTIPPPQINIPAVRSINIIRENSISSMPPLLKTPGAINEEAPPTIDAAKRKTLPAWIREGLEKMEREKLKEKDNLKSNYPDCETKTSQSSNVESEIVNIKPEDEVTVGSNPIKSSKKVFVKSSPTTSDSDDAIGETKKSFSNSSKKHLTSELLKKSNKTFDEIMEELMLVVRKSLTELLLEVTNEEIQNISQETIKKHKLKASSAQVFRKSAISSITGKLGLGAYADSSASSDDENKSKDSDDENGNSDQEKDSEDELREKIRIRQNAFKLIAQEIELAVSKEDANKESTKDNRHSSDRSHYSSSKGSHGGVSDTASGNTYNYNSSSGSKRYSHVKDFGETQQTDKKTFANGKRLKERTSRFTDNKDSRHKSTSSSYLVPIIQPALQPLQSPSTSYSHSQQTYLKKESKKQKTTGFDAKSSENSKTSKKHRRHSSSSSNSSKSSSNDSRYHHRRRHGHYRHDNDDRRRKRHDSEKNSTKHHRDADGNDSTDSDNYRKSKNDTKKRKKSYRNKSRTRSRSNSARSRSRSKSSSYASSRRHERY